MSLDNPSAAPPRRVLSASPSPTSAKYPQTSHNSWASRRRFQPLPATSAPPFTTPTTEPKDPSEWDSHPSLLTALSKSTTSNALLAGKALLIATALVGVGAFGFVSAVQYFTGTSTVAEFARLMRYWTDQYLRPVKDRIHRPPENEEERRAAFGVGEDDDWTWEEAEKRMKRAYEDGGYSLWSQVVLRELEAEARAERVRRRREVAAEVASRSRPIL